MLRIISFLLLISCFGLSSSRAMQTQLGKRKKILSSKSTEPSCQPSSKKQRTKLPLNKFVWRAIHVFEDLACGRISFTKEMQFFICQNPNIQNNVGDTLLHNAIRFHNQKLINRLLKFPELNINICNDQGKTPLFLAVSANNQDTVEKILLKNPDVLDAVSCLKIAHVIQNEKIIELLEKFLSEVDGLQCSMLRFSVDRQISRQRSGKYGHQYELIHNFKNIYRAKQAFLQHPKKLLKVFIDDSSVVKPDWESCFEEEEVYFLRTVFAENNLFWLHNLIFGKLNEECELIDVQIFDDFLINVAVNISQKNKETLKKSSCGIPLDVSNYEELQSIQSIPPVILPMLEGIVERNDVAMFARCMTQENAYLINAQNDLFNPYDTTFYQAIIKKNFEIAYAILPYHPNLNIKNEDGSTALHLAVESGNLEFVKAILLRNPDFTVLDKDGKTPLDLAAALDRVDIFKAIFDCYAQKPGLDLERILHDAFLCAFDNENFEMIKEILLYYSAFGFKDESEGTALHLAVNSCSPIVVENILRHCSSDLINAQDKFGKTPLHVAISKASQLEKAIEVVDVIIHHFEESNITIINPNIRDNNGCTALVTAIYSKSFELVKRILNLEPDVSYPDEWEKQAALHHAVLVGNTEIVKEILKHNPNLDLKNAQGYTALSLAEKREKHAIVKLIQGHICRDN